MVVLHKNFNGVETKGYFHNWSNAKIELDKEVESMCKKYGGEIRNKVVEVGEKWTYAVYAFLGEHGGCGWYLEDTEFEDA